MSAPLTKDEIAALRSTVEAMTEEPWAWESFDDKNGGWCIGIACTEGGVTLSGRIKNRDDMVDDLVRREIGGDVGRCPDNLRDPEGIVALRNAADRLLSAAEEAIALAEENERLRVEIARLKTGSGPDDPAGCPAGNGEQCCGWHEACRAALSGEGKEG